MRGVRLLVAEDELKMASLLRRGLTEEGYAVDVALDGLEALVRAGATEYDAIVALQGPSSRFAAAAIDAARPLLLEHAESISRELGWRPS